MRFCSFGLTYEMINLMTTAAVNTTNMKPNMAKKPIAVSCKSSRGSSLIC